MKLVDKIYFSFRNFFARYFPAFYAFCEARKKVLKFILSGTLTGISDLLFLFLFHGYFGLGIVLSTSLAFILSFALSFSLQKVWTFRNQDKDKLVHQLSVYFFNAFLDLNINALLMYVLVNRFGVWYLFAQLAVNATIGSLNFFVYKFVIFRKDKKNMKIELSLASLGDNPENFLRRAGYAILPEREDGEISFARRFGRDFYPRFHIYFKLFKNPSGDKVVFNLHLDQKKPGYAGFSRHNAEYDGEVVEREAARLEGLVVPSFML